MKKAVLIVTALLLCALLVLSVWLWRALSGLPDVAVLKAYRPAAAAEVLDKDGAVLSHFYDRAFRVWVPIASLPDIVVQAVVIAEDDTFFEHHGVNYKATWDALKLDVQKRRFVRGGSTITQQMIKNVFLTRDKTLRRKIREYVLARRAEQVLSKKKILEIYLNEVEWGDNIYGIEAASRHYYGKHASELTAGQAGLLAGMLPNPRFYNPFKRPDKALNRRDQVLFNMHQAHVISDEAYQQAKQEQLPAQPGNAVSGQAGGSRSCYEGVMEQALLARFGEQSLYRGGMLIRTSLDRRLQEEIASREQQSRTSVASDVKAIPVVLDENGLIRAFLCAQQQRDTLEAAGRTYAVSAIAYDSVPFMNSMVSIESGSAAARP